MTFLPLSPFCPCPPFLLLLCQLDENSQKLDEKSQKLDEIGQILKATKEHLNHQQDTHSKLMKRRAQIKADGKSFKLRQKGNRQSKELVMSAILAQTREKKRRK